MRVLHVCLDGNLPRYGVGLAVIRLAESLARAGVATALACRADGARGLSLEGVEVVPLEHRRTLLGGTRLGYLRQLAPALAARPDVVHVHALARAGRWLLPARARPGARLVATCHSDHELGPAASPAAAATPARARRHRRHVRAVLRGADALVAHSRATRGALVAAGAPASRVAVLPLGPTDAGPAPPPRPHAGFTALALLRFVPTKAPLVLVEAFARAFGSDPDATLVMAGEGPLRAAAEDAARAGGLGARARFPGWVEGAERRALLAGADVVVVPSVAGETFCLAALDAQAAGVALLASAQGALAERAEGGAALLVPPGDPAALAAALSRLRADPGLRARLAERGRAAAARHAWPEVAARHLALYRGLLAGAPVQVGSWAADPEGSGPDPA